MELAKDIEAGQAVYSRFVLSIYDVYLFGILNKYVWRCPTRNLIQNYNQHVTGNHLDIGVGSGFLLDSCRFPIESPNIGLIDLNTNCLEATSSRIKRYNPVTFKRNVFESLSISPHMYDSVGMNYLLHCLPGTMESKSVVFDNVLEVVNPGGVVFGATMVQKGVPVSWPAKRLMKIYNKKGIFSNTEDSIAEFENILSAKFARYSLNTYGCVAIFSCEV